MTLDSRRKQKTALALAVALAVPAEGLRNYAYRDPVGIPTICFGTTKDVKLGDYKNLDECKFLLNEDMQIAVDAVTRCGPPDLTVNQVAAFADLVYNAGPLPICGPSTLNRKLKAGDLIGACNELPRWDKAKILGVYVALPGLTKRRLEEQKLCLT